MLWTLALKTGLRGACAGGRGCEAAGAGSAQEHGAQHHPVRGELRRDAHPGARPGGPVRPLRPPYPGADQEEFRLCAGAASPPCPYCASILCSYSKQDFLSFDGVQNFSNPSPFKFPQRITEFPRVGVLLGLHAGDISVRRSRGSYASTVYSAAAARIVRRASRNHRGALPAALHSAAGEGAPVAAPQFEDLEDAKDAMQGVNQLEYKGRILTVEYVAREANGRCILCVSTAPAAPPACGLSGNKHSASITPTSIHCWAGRARVRVSSSGIRRLVLIAALGLMTK